MSGDSDEPHTDTITLGRDDGGAGATARRDHLFVVIVGERPLAPSSRHDLAEIDSVELVRGGATLVVTRSQRRLRVALPDRKVSTRHARLIRRDRHWQLEDLGSKNGTFLAGGRVTAPVQVDDGVVMSVGQTCLLLRLHQPSAGPLDVDATTVVGPLATLSCGLGAGFGDLARVVRAGAAVLIQGDTGTGKERVARAVHAIAARRGDFIAINCGAVPPTLLASELFGHRRGAFSGAVADRVGLFAAADGGTLFLDEIGDLPLEVQPALLRVLQEREVLPLGATRPQPIDVQVVSASHRDLGAAVAAGDFRIDLHARLADFTLVMPPLRERREDLGLILAEVIGRHAAAPEVVSLSHGALMALFEHGWPQNVRELDSVIKVALALAEDGQIRDEHLSGLRPHAATAPAGETTTEPTSVEARRKAELIRLLEQHGGNVAAVARALDRQRTMVHRWLRQYGIDPVRFRR